MVGFRVVVASAPEERTFAALHCAVLWGAIRGGIAERFAVVDEVVVAVLVRVPGVLAPSHLHAVALHIRLRRHDTRAPSVLPRVLGVPEGFHRSFLRSLRSGPLSFARELNQCPVVQAPVIHSIIFPSAILPVAPVRNSRKGGDHTMHNAKRR